VEAGTAATGHGFCLTRLSHETQRRPGENEVVLDDVIGYLACPYCADGLARAGGSLRCAAGHTFDIARQGYVSLLPAGATGGAGDSAPMLAARAEFLAAGHFAPLARDLAGMLAGDLGEVVTRGGPGSVAAGDPDEAMAGDVAAPDGVPGCVADAGAGTGYFLAAVLDRWPGRAGLALDVSKFALRRAARAHPRIGAAGCDVWRRLPVADGAAAAVLSVFAPRNGAELRRVLHPRGQLLVVTPEPGHLGELIGPLGLLRVDRHKDERLAAQLGGYFAVTARRPHLRRLRLSHPEVAVLVAMGPSARHLEAGTLAARLSGLPDPVPVTVDVTLTVYKPRVPVVTHGDPHPAAG
jgi:23S rRNA (guanine745-N1)-methyltransferase